MKTNSDDILTSGQWPIEKVIDTAIKKNSPLLHNAIKYYQAGEITWEQAMQMSVVIMINLYAQLFDQFVGVSSRCVPKSIALATRPDGGVVFFKGRDDP